MDNKKYYITTAIAYTSGKPHIGNSYEIVMADAIARFKKLEGYDVWFQTGTDEHGQKIEEKAKAANITPKEFVDDVASVIKNICKSLNVNYDRFIRTTDEDHEKQTTKATFTREHMKECTARPVNRSGPRASSLTENVLTAEGK